MNFNVNAVEMGTFDVIVCGGGTAGCMAAISAAKNGAKTLMIERGSIPGGMITGGNAGITKSVVHTHDAKKYKEFVLDMLAKEPNKVQVVGGYTKKYIDALIENGGGVGTSGQAGSYVFTSLYPAIWTMMDMLDSAGVTPLYMTNVCGAVCENDKLTGVVVYNKSGFGVYKADCIIDATGDADVAEFSGAEYVLGAGEDDIKDFNNCDVGDMMGFGSMFRIDNVDLKKLVQYLIDNPEKFHLHEFGVMEIDNVKASLENNEMVVFRFRHGDSNQYLMQVYNTPIKNQCILLTGIHRKGTDGLNTEYVSKCIHELHGIIREKLDNISNVPGFENMVVNNIPEIGIRETRHIVGEYKLTASDVLTGRHFDDCVCKGGHPVDIGGISTDVGTTNTPDMWSFEIPYRCMVPKKIDGLLVTGRSICATRVASGATRPTVQCMMLGEAAGCAAAIAVKNKIEPRNIDINELKQNLVNQGAVI